MKYDPYHLDKVYIRLVKEPGGPLISTEPLNTPERIAQFLQREVFGDLDREIFAVVNLKSNLTLAGMKMIDLGGNYLGKMHADSINVCSMGALNESVVHPRECLKSSILSNACSVLLVHNHPSGKLDPSKEDIMITDRLVQAYDLLGIPVVDHIILGPKEQYYSFHENAIMPFPQNKYVSVIEDLALRKSEQKQTEKKTKGRHKTDYER